MCVAIVTLGIKHGKGRFFSNVLLVMRSRRQFPTNKKDQTLLTIPPFKSVPYHSHILQFPTSIGKKK